MMLSSPITQGEGKVFWPLLPMVGFCRAVCWLFLVVDCCCFDLWENLGSESLLAQAVLFIRAKIERQYE
jgi:hypothetical protein